MRMGKSIIILKAGTFSGYKLQGRKKFAGFKISIENKKGSYRHWTDHNGKKGKTKMICDYGYILGTMGADSEKIDVFLGPNEKPENVYVIHQNIPETGKYDEDKVMLGFNNSQEAKKAYLKHYDSPKFYGSMSILSMDQFKEKAMKTLHGKKKTLKKAVMSIKNTDGTYREPFNILMKGKPAEVGETRTYAGGVKKKKVAPGKWVVVSDGKKKVVEPKKKPDKKKPEVTKKPDISTPEGKKEAVKNAIKGFINSMADVFSGGGGAGVAAGEAQRVGGEMQAKGKIAKEQVRAKKEAKKKIQKAQGKVHLIKKIITNKKGKKQTVYVRPEGKLVQFPKKQKTETVAKKDEFNYFKNRFIEHLKLNPTKKRKDKIVKMLRKHSQLSEDQRKTIIQKIEKIFVEVGNSH